MGIPHVEEADICWACLTKMVKREINGQFLPYKECPVCGSGEGSEHYVRCRAKFYKRLLFVHTILGCSSPNLKAREDMARIADRVNKGSLYKDSETAARRKKKGPVKH